MVTRVGLNIRGRSTAGFPKPGYALEVWDEYNQDRNVEVDGMPEGSWDGPLNTPTGGLAAPADR